MSQVREILRTCDDFAPDLSRYYPHPATMYIANLAMKEIMSNFVNK